MSSETSSSTELKRLAGVTETTTTSSTSSETSTSALLATKVIVLSNIQIGATCFDRSEDKHLAHGSTDCTCTCAACHLSYALHEFSRRADVKEIVLLGDIFETWQHRADMKMPTDPCQEIRKMKGCQELIDGLLQCQRAGIVVRVVKGERESLLNWQQLTRLLGSQILKHEKEYRFQTKNGLWINMEHGHRFDLLCCVPGAVSLGYALARNVASGKVSSDCQLLVLDKSVDESKCVAEAASKLARQGLLNLQKLVGGESAFCLEEQVSWNEAIANAESAYAHVQHSYHKLKFAVDKDEDHIVKQGAFDDTDVLVIGHTLEPNILDLGAVSRGHHQAPRPRVFANAGSWGASSDRLLSYLEIDINSGNIVLLGKQCKALDASFTVIRAFAHSH